MLPTAGAPANNYRYNSSMKVLMTLGFPLLYSDSMIPSAFLIASYYLGGCVNLSDSKNSESGIRRQNLNFWFTVD